MTTASPSTAVGDPRGDLPLPPTVVARALWILWALALVLGAVGVWQRITEGHLPAGYGSYVPWGLWVAFYFHGVGLAGGAFVIGAGGFILDVPGFRQKALLRAVTVFSVAAILPAFVGVWLDLGHLDRSHRIFTSPAFTSMMAFNAWMYGVFLVVAAIGWLLTYRDESVWLKPVLCLAVFLSILFPSQSGAFFGVVDAKPYWHSALLPMVFLASAVTSGAGALLVLRAILGRLDGASVPGNGFLSDTAAEYAASMAWLRYITLGGLIVYFAFEFAELSIALWNPGAHAPAVELMLWGPYWWVFWIVHLFLGGALPLVLLASRNRTAWTVGGVCVAVAFISARLNVLVPGQAVGELEGLQEAFQHPRLSYIYHATGMEYLVGFGLLAMGMAVFYVGQWISAALAERLEKQRDRS